MARIVTDVLPKPITGKENEVTMLDLEQSGFA
jgi:hypothetical protein